MPSYGTDFFFFPAVICPVNICLHFSGIRFVVAGMMMIMISVLGC